LITAVVVVLVGVEQGVLLAMALSPIDHTRRGYRSKNTVVLKADRGWRTQPVTRPDEFEPGLLVDRFSRSMYYANAEQFSEEVAELVMRTKPPVRWFCIDASAIDSIGFSAGQTLRSVCDFLKKRGIRLVFAMVAPELEAGLDRYGLSEMLGEHAFFASGYDLVDAFHREAGAGS
jgi:SulP family sulfate permease